MRFAETKLPGVTVIDVDKLEDERGFFARMFCRRELAEHGLSADLAQASMSFNRARGTLRGMHYQVEPHAETKIVSVTAGAVFDVVVDLRAASPSFRSWFGIELSSTNLRALLVPPGLAHGFITLTDDTVVHYHINELYRAEAARGVRWDDPAFAIDWPFEPLVMAERDRRYQDFTS